MKKLVLVAVAFVFLFAAVGTAMAAKPTGLGGAQTYAWYLSGAVMPIPPYSYSDIPGSDTASKLIVNQPNGNTEVTITGVMNGLNPNTTYTVYLSKRYTPYVFTGWNVAGSYVVNVEYLGINYSENLVLAQSGTNITGVFLELVGGGSRWIINSGSVIGSALDFYGYYEANSTMTVHFSGTIAADGSISGNWNDVTGLSRTGTWTTTTGTATKTHTGSAGWPGLFTSTVQPFTFTTDAYGSGSWHVNLTDANFPGPGTYTLSVWINAAGGTLLISDNFDVKVD